MEGGAFLQPEKILINLKMIKPGMRIADFGCGSGYFSLPLARIVGPDGTVYAFDILTSALDLLHARAKELGLYHIKAIRADLEVQGSTGLRDGSVDAVLIASVLFQSQEKDAILKEAMRILRAGGWLVVIEWSPSSAFGPPKDLRILPSELRREIEHLGFTFRSDLKTTSTHYGFLFSR